MIEERFWELIELARCGDDFYETLGAMLEDSSAEEIIGFENVLRRMIAEAGTFPVLAANFVIVSYVSDDVFEDFRAWLVSQGHERYMAALAGPESICDWLDRDDIDDIDGSSMVMIAQEAYEQFGEAEEFDKLVEFSPEPNIEEDWPDSKDEYRRRYPRLVEKFWNQDRIEEYHRPE